MIGLISDFISILGAGYSHISGIKHGKQIEAILSHLEKSEERMMEKLSSKIFVRLDEAAIKIANLSKEEINRNLREIRQKLDPISQAIDGKILSSAVVTTPSRVKDVFGKNPWEVLVSVRPFHRAEKQKNPDMIPIFFEDKGIQYLGWQMKGVLPLLFDFELNPNSGLFQDVGTSATGTLFDKYDYILFETIGIETLGGVFFPIIEKGTLVPITHQDSFTTAEDNQLSIEVHVLSGENSKVEYNISLGKFHFNGVPPAPKGIPQIEVAISIDEKGNVVASAKDMGTGKYISSKLKPVKIRKVGRNVDNIEINCPGCHSKLRIPAKRHIKVTCPRCDHKFRAKNTIIFE